MKLNHGKPMKINLMRFFCIAGLTLMSLSTHAHDQAQHAHQPADVGKKAALAIGTGFAPDGALWVLQQDLKSRLTLQISRDDGKSWQAPRVLDTGSDHIKTSDESNPKLAFGPNGAVVIVYAQRLSKQSAGEVRLLRSTDGGATFAAPVTVHHDRQVISHRSGSIAFDAQGKLHTVWIDDRDMELAKQAGAKSGSAKPAYRGAAIYRNVSTDGGATFGADTKVADYICECCRIALTPTADGQVAALWRHVYAPNIRDHAFAVLGATGAAVPVKTPVRATFDNWALDACPDHGPGLTPAPGGGYHAVWFGERAGAAQVRYGRLDRNGKPAGAVLALPDERAEHADVLSAGKRVAIVWRSFDGSGMNLKAWVSDDDGQHFTLRQLARTEADSDYPRLVRKDEQLFVLWNTTGKRHVEAL